MECITFTCDSVHSHDWWVAVKVNGPLRFAFSAVQHFTQRFKQRIGWETLLWSLQLLSLPWNHVVVLPKIVTFQGYGEKKREHKEEIRKTMLLPWCVHCSCFSWWRSISRVKVTRISEEIKLVASAISELCLSEGINQWDIDTVVGRKFYLIWNLKFRSN